MVFSPPFFSVKSTIPATLFGRTSLSQILFSYLPRNTWRLMKRRNFPLFPLFFPSRSTSGHQSLSLLGPSKKWGFPFYFHFSKESSLAFPPACRQVLSNIHIFERRQKNFKLRFSNFSALRRISLPLFAVVPILHGLFSRIYHTKRVLFFCLLPSSAWRKKELGRHKAM